MIENTLKYRSRNDLILPEYGRNIQRMVEIAKSIEDRDERNRCARTIIDSMGNLFPYLRDVENYKHKLWDHLAIMANFELDIDYPYNVYKPENMAKHPDKIIVNKERIKARHYGRIIEGFIKEIAENNKIQNRAECTMIVANQMRKLHIAWNKEVVDDVQIFEDIMKLSDGKIKLAASEHKLNNERQGGYNNNGKKQNYKRS